MGQFLDPPITYKAEKDTPKPNAANINTDGSSVAYPSARTLIDTENAKDIDVSAAQELMSKTNSCPEVRKVSDPVDPRGEVKYSYNESSTAV